MKSLAKSLAPFLLAVTLIGCGEAADKPMPEFCEGTTCEQTLSPVVTGVFVSGHLGNYRDCPGDGYTGEVAVGGSTSEGEPVAPPGEQGDFAPCMEGDESCTNAILNCEQAQLTVSLSNLGDAIATGLQVDRVELYNLDGDKVADLPVQAVSEQNEAYDGDLDIDESTTLRVDFQGPQNPYKLLSSGPDSDAGRFAGDGHDGEYRDHGGDDEH
jgi:hypothetical protein